MNDALKLVNGNESESQSSGDVSNKLGQHDGTGNELLAALSQASAKAGIDSSKIKEVTEVVMPLVDKVGKRKIVAGLGILALAASAFIGDDNAK